MFVSKRHLSPSIWIPIKARHDGRCVLCNKKIRAGTMVEWDPISTTRGRVRHLESNKKCYGEEKANWEADNCDSESGWKE